MTIQNLQAESRDQWSISPETTVSSIIIDSARLLVLQIDQLRKMMHHRDKSVNDLAETMMVRQEKAGAGIQNCASWPDQPAPAKYPMRAYAKRDSYALQGKKEDTIAAKLIYYLRWNQKNQLPRQTPQRSERQVRSFHFSSGVVGP